MSTQSPNVTIAINNFNYERFVGRAITSALNQVGAAVEVVVVDDGSTDDSWSTVLSYGDRVQAVRQKNGGQVAAYNAGFARARGEWVLFLDADDELAPDAIATCLQRSSPNLAKIQFPLLLVGRDSEPLGGQVPFVLHDGDVRPIVRRFGSYAGPPSSGNLYRRAAIARYFPIPEAGWRSDVDTVPFVLSAFHGDVLTIKRPLGNYRIHASDQAEGVFGNVRRTLSAAAHIYELRRDRALALLALRSGIHVEGPFLPLPTACRTRAMSWRLSPRQHPYPEDSAERLLNLQGQSLREWPGYAWVDRIIQMAWMWAFLNSPLSIARALARVDGSGGSRDLFKRLTLRGGRAGS